MSKKNNPARKIKYIKIWCSVMIRLFFQLTITTLVFLVCWGAGAGMNTTGLLAVVATICSGILSWIPKAITQNKHPLKTADRFFNTIDRAVYRWVSKRIRNITFSDIMITKFNEAILKPQGEQSRFINFAMQTIREGDKKKIIVIEGAAGYGKTTTIFLLFHEMGMSVDADTFDVFSKLNKNSYYFDCFTAPDKFNRFIHSYNNSELEGKYIFLDNWGNLSNPMQESCAESIILPFINTGSLRAQLLIIMIDAKNSLTPMTKHVLGDTAINQIALKNPQFMALRNDVDKINKHVFENFPGISCEENVLETYKLWLYHIRDNKNFNLMWVDSLLGTSFMTDKPEDYAVWFSIVIVCRYKSTFQLSDILRVISSVDSNKISVKYIRKLLKKYREEKVISIFPLYNIGHKYYYFSHSISKMFRWRFLNSSLYIEMARAYYKQISEFDNPVLIWLSFIDLPVSYIKDETQKNKIFHKAFAVGNFCWMRRELEFVCEQNTHKRDLFAKELGY